MQAAHWVPTGRFAVYHGRKEKHEKTTNQIMCLWLLFSNFFIFMIGKWVCLSIFWCRNINKTCVNAMHQLKKTIDDIHKRVKMCSNVWTIVNWNKRQVKWLEKKIAYKNASNACLNYLYSYNKNKCCKLPKSCSLNWSIEYWRFIRIEPIENNMAAVELAAYQSLGNEICVINRI